MFAFSSARTFSMVLASSVSRMTRVASALVVITTSIVGGVPAGTSGVRGAGLRPAHRLRCLDGTRLLIAAAPAPGRDQR